MSRVNLKRTLEPEGEVDSGTQAKRSCMRSEVVPSYCVQRQVVLQLSLQKLYSPLSLGRRILITNTLRRIQNEISHPGASRLSAGDNKETWESAAGQELDQALTRPPDGDGELLLSLHSSHEIEAEIEKLTAEKSDAFHSQTPPLHTSPRNTEPPEKEVQTLPNTESQGEPANLAHSPTHSLINSSSTASFPVFLPDLSLDDFLFTEIDNFLCELNPCPNFEPGSSSKVVSMVTDDLVRSLTTQPFKTDLNELDHIMELLVGS